MEAEKIIHAYRVRQVELIRHCDLDDIERIGRAFIFAAMTREPQIISQSAGTLAMAAQSAIMTFFTMLYLATLSIYAFCLTIIIFCIALVFYYRKLGEANENLHVAAGHEDQLFKALSDVLDGFKEVRLNKLRSHDLGDYVNRISSDVTLYKSKVDLNFSSLYVFYQTIFYLLAASMVFLLPKLGQDYSEGLLKTTTVILFLIGPITSVVGSSNAVARANAACESLLALERKLEDAAKRSRATGQVLRGFEAITFDHVLFKHRNERDKSTFVVGPINLTIRRGEMLFISGGNGSGKSTFLRLLTALYTPNSGIIAIDGEPVTEANRETYQSLFATVFADFHLFPRPYGLGALDAATFDRMLAEMELPGKTRLLDGRFETLQLSTGQRKRLALIVSRLEDRPIDIFDEWAADQDPSFRRKFYEEILPALKAEGRTIIAVTHDDRYHHLCDRRLVMEEGRIVRVIEREPA